MARLLKMLAPGKDKSSSENQKPQPPPETKHEDVKLYNEERNEKMPKQNEISNS